MQIEQMRHKIANCYPGASWKARCFNMSTKQVVAVYHAFRKNGKLDSNKKRKDNSSREYKQMTVWDYI